MTYLVCLCLVEIDRVLIFYLAVHTQTQKRTRVHFEINLFWAQGTPKRIFTQKLQIPFFRSQYIL